MQLRTCLLLTLAFAMTSCAVTPKSADRQVAADATDGKFSLTTFEWDDEVLTNESVSIINTYGDLRVRSAIGKHVVVSAQIQRFSGDDRDVEITVQHVGNQLQVRIREKQLAAQFAAPGTERGSNGRFDGRIDMALLLPKLTPLSAETGAGFLQVKGHKAEANLKTGSGKLLATTSGLLVAHTATGELRASFKATQWNSAARISSDSGNIMVTVPEKANLAIDAKSRGEVTARLGKTLTRKGDSAYATLGDGSANLLVRSATGRIELRQAGLN